MSKKENILIKLSGAFLKGDDGIINHEKVNKLADELIQSSNYYNIGVVIGGGNIWRGNISSKIGMDRSAADEMGMLATIINSLALKSAINAKNKKAIIYSSLSIPRIVNEHNTYNIKKDLDENNIVIFAAGTGMPFFSTDTAAALNASQINAKYILMGKNNIDGLYDKDPNKYSDAQFIESISFNDVISRKLAVADLTCMTMCQENNIDILIFDIEKPNSIPNVLKMQGIYSHVYNEKSLNDQNNSINQDNNTNFENSKNEQSFFESQKQNNLDFNFMFEKNNDYSINNSSNLEQENINSNNLENNSDFHKFFNKEEFKSEPNLYFNYDTIDEDLKSIDSNDNIVYNNNYMNYESINSNKEFNNKQSYDNIKSSNKVLEKINEIYRKNNWRK